MIAITALIEGVFPGNGGPFHTRRRRRPARPGCTLALVIGAVLQLAAADGLRRGRRLAWAFVTILKVLSLIVLIGADHERRAQRRPGPRRRAARCSCSSAFRAFSARSHRKSFRHAGRRLLWVAGGLFVYTAVGFFVLQDDFVPTATPIDMLGRVLQPPGVHDERQHRAGDHVGASGSSTRSAPCG